MRLNALKFVNRKKVESDYEALQERLSTLPDKLSYDIMVCTVWLTQNNGLTVFSISGFFCDYEVYYLGLPYSS